MPFDGSNLTEVQRVLIAARARIEAGWCHDRYQYRDKRGGVCVIAAIYDAGNSEIPFPTPTTKMAMDAFLSVIRIRNPRYGLAGWNDAPQRKKRHVLAAFDRAVVRAGCVA